MQVVTGCIWVSFQFNNRQISTNFKGERGRGVCFLMSMYSLNPCFPPALAQRSLLLSLLAGPNSLCTRKGFLPSSELQQEEGWVAKVMVGTVGEGESKHLHDVLEAGSCVAVTAWCPVLCMTQLFDK